MWPFIVAFIAAFIFILGAAYVAFKVRGRIMAWTEKHKDINDTGKGFKDDRKTM